MEKKFDRRTKKIKLITGHILYDDTPKLTNFPDGKRKKNIYSPLGSS